MKNKLKIIKIGATFYKKLRFKNKTILVKLVLWGKWKNEKIHK